MVFARCLTYESDLFFASAAARTSHSSRADANNSLYTTRKQPQKELRKGSSVDRTAATTVHNENPSSAIMPTFLSWTRKSSSNNSGAASVATTTTATKAMNQEKSPPKTQHKHHHHHHHHHKGRSQPRSTEIKTSGSVIFRRGDKSFLEFHQNYAISRHLGEGSYSTVKQVTHRKRGGQFACKIVDKNALSAVDRAALSHEVQVLAKVRHNHIMKLYEVIEDDAKCYLIMELAEHGDLFDKIVKQGKFPEHEAQKVAAALCEALYYCHSNAIIHRDVKPENVLLSSDPHCIKLCDFGFAKQLNHVDEQSSDSCGTPGYAAPEILDGKPYGVEVDVFSLGVVTYIMMCGYPPFPMKLSQLRTHRFNIRFPSKDWALVDVSVKEMITKMLHVKPDLRPKMSELRMHPWFQQGKKLLDKARAEAEARLREEALQRKQLIADTIRKKLTSAGGFEVVKHGRQGQPHRTKLRLSPDGRVLSWQPKLLKRGLLKYHQNAKSLTSFFGFGGGSKSPKHVAAHPQISRLSSFDSAQPSTDGGRFSEPILADDTTRSAIVTRLQHDPTAVLGASHGSHHQLSKADSVASNSSAGSANWIDKKNWWRSFRRSHDKQKGSTAAPAERSASGGFTCGEFSLATPQSASAPGPSERSFSASSSCLGALDSNDGSDPMGSSRVSLTSEPSSPTTQSPGPSPRFGASGVLSTPPLSPKSAATTERILDTSINLRDIRSVTLGEDCAFFQGLTGQRCSECEENNLQSGTPTGRVAAKSTSATESVCSEDDTPEDASSTKKKTSIVNSDLNVAMALSIATRYRELHLEFASEELRDAFSFLLEQATLPLEGVLHPQQQTFIFRSPMTPTKGPEMAAESENNEHDDEPQGRVSNNNDRE